MISILCDTHGLFKQTPDGHLSGNGCPHCGRDTISKKLTKWTRENFIEACIKKHNRFYSYVKTLYRGLDKKITIICPNHAEFEQIANSHLRYGCFKCASEKKGIERRLGLEEFIDAAKKIHNSCYDYTKFNYTNYATPSIIICREHGEFEQTPAQHLRKHAVGCGKCGKKPYSREEIEWLDSLVCDYPEIQYATRGRQYLISTTRKHADGYDPVTNTVFEFQGCYFHGCKDCFPEQTTTNKLVKKTFQELFDLTLRREETVRSLGYNYVQIWQCEWRKQRGTLIKEAF